MEAEKFEGAFEFRGILDQAARSPFRYFEKWPIVEVWERCLKAMGERETIYKEEADWAEKWINTLLERNVNRDIKEKLLSWYVFAAKGELAIRAIEFALSLRQNVHILQGDLSKLIIGRLTKDDGFKLYPNVPSLHKFLEELLDEIKKQSCHGYFSGEWYGVERALRVIRAMKDVSFLLKVEVLLLLMQEKTIFPSGLSGTFSDEFFDRQMHMAALKTTIRVLLKARKEQLLES